MSIPVSDAELDNLLHVAKFAVKRQQEIPDIKRQIRILPVTVVSICQELIQLRANAARSKEWAELFLGQCPNCGHPRNECIPECEGCSEEHCVKGE